jgi:hypothetical protein
VLIFSFSVICVPKEQFPITFQKAVLLLYDSN